MAGWMMQADEVGIAYMDVWGSKHGPKGLELSSSSQEGPDLDARASRRPSEQTKPIERPNLPNQALKACSPSCIMCNSCPTVHRTSHFSINFFIRYFCFFIWVVIVGLLDSIHNDFMALIVWVSGLSLLVIKSSLTITQVCFFFPPYFIYIFKGSNNILAKDVVLQAMLVFGLLCSLVVRLMPSWAAFCCFPFSIDELHLYSSKK